MVVIDMAQDYEAKLSSAVPDFFQLILQVIVVGVFRTAVDKDVLGVCGSSIF